MPLDSLEKIPLTICVFLDAGSEATPIIGQTEKDASGNPLKTTQKTLTVLPETIIYDIDLTLR